MGGRINGHQSRRTLPMAIQIPCIETSGRRKKEKKRPISLSRWNKKRVKKSGGPVVAVSGLRPIQGWTRYV